MFLKVYWWKIKGNFILFFIFFYQCYFLPSFLCKGKKMVGSSGKLHPTHFFSFSYSLQRIMKNGIFSLPLLSFNFHSLIFQHNQRMKNHIFLSLFLSLILHPLFFNPTIYSVRVWFSLSWTTCESTKQVKYYEKTFKKYPICSISINVTQHRLKTFMLWKLLCSSCSLGISNLLPKHKISINTIRKFPRSSCFILYLWLFFIYH